MTVAFKTLRRDAVADQAIETIKEMIVRGDVRAGQRLPPERELAALAAERATDLELADLDDLVTEGRAKLSDPDAFIDYDVEFHDRVRRFARSPVLASMLGSVSLLSLESRRRTAQVAAVRSRAAS